ncbi:MAG: phosphatase PAP2 family protein [Muribaculaceae bacterium]|nr:phosphatase PAP2 family protein [Muribaculaceae bacterium]
MRKQIITLLLLFVTVKAFAYYPNTNITSTIRFTDTIKLETIDSKMGDLGKVYYKTTAFDRISSSKAFEIAGFGVPIIVTALAIKPQDNRFSNYLRPYPSTFKNSFDDYTQYAPLAAKYIMKACGVKGRSSWLRMFVSDAFAAAIMAATVNTMKYTITMPRPTGGATNSFPSGHTATAFMSATLLNKEFGHLSPWIPITSYALASATAVGRQLNLRHWLSDVLVGAGIGVVSAELGYYFADLIFKEKGLKYQKDTPRWEYGRKPSFFATVAGVSFVVGDNLTKENLRIKPGSVVGVEGAYFPHKNVGVGMRATVSENIMAKGDVILEDGLKTLSLNAGSYFDVPLSSRWALSSKLLFGYDLYNNRSSWSNYNIATNNGSATMTTGGSFAFLATEKLRISLMCDYHLKFLSHISEKPQHELYLTATTSVMF